MLDVGIYTTGRSGGGCLRGDAAGEQAVLGIILKVAEDDLNRLKELVKAMQNLTIKTGDAREEYDRCESAVAQIIASMRV